MFISYLPSNCRRAATSSGWFARGGMLGGEHPPSGRFNAGEKIVFWGGLFVLSTFVIVSGFVLDKIVPGLDLTRPEMQVAHIVHAIASMFIIAMFIGHAYMGTIGVSGSWQAMKTGYVDEGWAEEHHKLWHDDIAAGKVPAQRTVAAARPRAARRLIARGIQMRLSCLVVAAAASSLASARRSPSCRRRRRGEGEGRRNGQQGGVDRQGRRLQAVPVDGPRRRRRIARASAGAGKSASGARADAALHRSRPVRAAADHADGVQAARGGRRALAPGDGGDPAEQQGDVGGDDGHAQIDAARSSASPRRARRSRARSRSATSSARRARSRSRPSAR